MGYEKKPCVYKGVSPLGRFSLSALEIAFRRRVKRTGRTTGVFCTIEVAYTMYCVFVCKVATQLREGDDAIVQEYLLVLCVRSGGGDGVVGIWWW